MAERFKRIPTSATSDNSVDFYVNDGDEPESFTMIFVGNSTEWSIVNMPRTAARKMADHIYAALGDVRGIQPGTPESLLLGRALDLAKKHDASLASDIRVLLGGIPD